MGIRSAYRAIKERVKKPSILKEMFELDTLQGQLDSDWKTVEKEELQTDSVLVGQRGKAQAFLDAGNAKDAGPAIVELQRLIPEVKKRSAMRNQFKAQLPDRAEAQERASDEQRAQQENAAENQPNARWEPDSAWGQALTQEANHDAAILTATQEPAAAGRQQNANRPAKEVVVKLDKKSAPVNINGMNFSSKITLDGKAFENPEFLGKGGFGTAVKYTTADGKTVVMKAVTAGGEDLEQELAINRRLAEGPPDAVGRENVLLMKGFVQGDDGTSYIVMDQASGDLDMTKYGMNALSETGALPEEARNVLNQHIMKQALQGTKYMHDQGVDHFDLKEGNMLIMPDGTVKVIDFGGSVADLQDGAQNVSTYTPQYSGSELKAMKHGATEVSRNKWDAFSLGTMLKTLQRGEQPGGKAEGDLTGALSHVQESLTNDTKEDRSTLEAALESSYFRNLDNYQPETIKELMAATVAYSSALAKKKVDGKSIQELSEAVHATRAEIQEHEKALKDPEKKGEIFHKLGLGNARITLEKQEAELRMLSNDDTVKPHLDKIRELSQRLQSGR